MNLVVLGKKIQADINKRGRLFFSRRKAHSLRKKVINKKNDTELVDITKFALASIVH